MPYMRGDGLVFIDNCKQCDGSGCSWCLASHMLKCVEKHGGFYDDSCEPPITVGYCQALPCLHTYEMAWLREELGIE